MPSSDLTVTVVGNLTRDPELRTLPSGSTVCNFSVAYTPRTYDRTSQSYKDGAPMYFRCAAWDSGRMTFAENIANTLSKGMRVIVQGTLTQRSYQGNDGQQRTDLELRVSAVGPELTFATAQVTRSGGNGGGYGDNGNGYGGNGGGYRGGASGGYQGGASGGNGGYQGGASRGGASNRQAAPQQGSQQAPADDPWGADAGSSFGSFDGQGGDDEFGDAAEF